MSRESLVGRIPRRNPTLEPPSGVNDRVVIFAQRARQLALFAGGAFRIANDEVPVLDVHRRRVFAKSTRTRTAIDAVVTAASHGLAKTTN